MSLDSPRKSRGAFDFVKLYPKWGALACSNKQPKRKLKGVWVVDDLDSVLHQKEKKDLESPEFELPNGNRMKLTLDFGSRAALKHDAIGLYFHNLGPDTDLDLQLSMFIKAVSARARRSKKNKYIAYFNTDIKFNDKDSSWGNAKFLEKSVLSAHGLDEVMRIQFTAKCLHPTKPAPQNVAAGLINHGTTCYANSILQSLNSIKEFRRAILAIPTEESEINTVPYAFQRVVYNLQTTSDPVSTKELMFALGLKESDLYTQHDIQEFKCTLADALEKVESRLTAPFQGIFKRLFEGRTTTSIRCVDIECKSSRTESFTDIPLNVRGCKSIHESFAKYLEEEELTGENRYLTDSAGLQPATKSQRFDVLPPVLFLHLKRFAYRSTDMKKINDFYPFETVLDLNRYCSSRGKANVYRLHSVIVHRGEPQFGHYFAYVCEDGTMWIKYDDKNVKEVEPAEAIEENFGGYYDTFLVDSKSGDIVEQRKEITSSAYMLVYIRESEYKEIQRPARPEDVPSLIHTRFERENQLFALRKQQADKLASTVPVYIVTPETIKEWKGYNIAPGAVSEGKSFFEAPECRLRLLADPDQTLQDFVSGIADQLDVPAEKLYFWVYEVQAHKPHFVSRTKTKSDQKLRQLKTANSKSRFCSSTKQRGIFLVLIDDDGTIKPICTKCEEEERKRREDQLNELKGFFGQIKREDLAEGVDREVPCWRLIASVGEEKKRAPISPSRESRPEEKREDSSISKASSSSKKEDSRTIPKLVFAKYIDPKEGSVRAVETLALKPEQSLKVLETMAKTELGLPEVEIFEEPNSPTEEQRKSTDLLDTEMLAENLYTATVVLCSAASQKTGEVKKENRKASKEKGKIANGGVHT